MYASVAKVPVDIRALYETGDSGLVEVHRQVVLRTLKERAKYVNGGQGPIGGGV